MAGAARDRPRRRRPATCCRATCSPRRSATPTSAQRGPRSSPRSGSTTWSSSPPTTPCWSPTPTTPREVSGLVATLEAAQPLGARPAHHRLPPVGQLPHGRRRRPLPGQAHHRQARRQAQPAEALPPRRALGRGARHRDRAARRGAHDRARERVGLHPDRRPSIGWRTRASCRCSSSRCSRGRTSGRTTSCAWPTATAARDVSKEAQEEHIMSAKLSLIVAKIVRTGVIAAVLALGACGDSDSTPIVSRHLERPGAQPRAGRLRRHVVRLSARPERPHPHHRLRPADADRRVRARRQRRARLSRWSATSSPRHDAGRAAADHRPAARHGLDATIPASASRSRPAVRSTSSARCRSPAAIRTSPT